MSPVAELSRRAADAATAARRDYTANAQAALSKRAERAMREGVGGAAYGVDVLPGNTPSLHPFQQSPQQQTPPQQQLTLPQQNGAKGHAAWGGAPSEPHASDSGSEEGEEDGGSRNEWRDILQSQHQLEEARMPSMASAAASAAAPQQGGPPLHGRRSAAAPAHQTATAMAAASSAASFTSAAPMAATTRLASDTSSPPSQQFTAARERTQAEHPMSEQEHADRQLAERLQREEATAEAQRRRRSREVFLAGSTAASTIKQGNMQPMPKRVKVGRTLDMFVTKRT